MRKATQQAILKQLSIGQRQVKEICGLMSQFNGWRAETNNEIVKEMVSAGLISRKLDLIFLPESARGH